MCDMENYNELCCGANVNICAGVLFGIALDFSDVIVVVVVVAVAVGLVVAAG